MIEAVRRGDGGAQFSPATQLEGNQVDTLQILKTAIRKEVEAHDVYADTAQRTDNPAVRALLSELAAEEARHRELLEGLPPEQADAFTPPEGRDMKISDHLEAKPLGAGSGLQEVMVHAMDRETAAREFYLAMADGAADPELKGLLEKLAAMENAHKARLEELYEDVFLREM